MISMRLVVSVASVLVVLFSDAVLADTRSDDIDHDNDASQPVFTLGAPEFFGSGCASPHSVQVAAFNASQGVSVRFSGFAAATTRSATWDRKTCNLVLPMHVRQGTSVAVVQVDYAGRVFVPRSPSSSSGGPGASVGFTNEYFFAGVRGAGVRETWPAGSNARLAISNQFQVGAVAWSPCGATAVFRINAALTASKPFPTAEDARITLDATSVALSGAMRFQVATKPCTNA